LIIRVKALPILSPDVVSWKVASQEDVLDVRVLVFGLAEISDLFTTGARKSLAPTNTTVARL
jgi:hypothetical protein